MKTFLADSLNINVPFHLIHFGNWGEGSKPGGPCQCYLLLPTLFTAVGMQPSLGKGSVALWHCLSDLVGGG